VGLPAQPERLGSIHFLFFLKEVIFHLIVANNDFFSLYHNSMILSFSFNQEMIENEGNKF
jgi:hypothetical protein